MIERTMNVTAKIESHASAGERSIKRKKGREAKKYGTLVPFR